MLCCGDKKTPSRNTLLFKLSFSGILLAFILTAIGLLGHSSQPAIQLPLSWTLAIVILLPSLMLYYRVRDAFWAEVIERKKEKDSGR